MTTEKLQSEYNIPLGNGKYAMIDLCDLDKVVGITFHWHKCRGQVEYARGSIYIGGGKNRQPFLHRIIMGDAPAPDLEIGHKDGNGLNCHKRNLRWVTHQQNMQGKRGKARGKSSQYRGVYKDVWARGVLIWKAKAMVNGKQTHLGSFDNELDAAKAYDTATRIHYGEHAACNFPLEEPK